MNNITKLKWGPKETATHYRVYSDAIYSVSKYYNYLGIRGDL